MTTALPGTASPASDRPAKAERVRALLAGRPRCTRLALTSQETLAWYLDGARVGVALNGAPVVAVTISLDDEVVHCLENEVDRMVTEELPAGVEVRSVPWHRPLLDDEAGLLREGAFLPELRAARASLLPLELERYRRLCRDAAAVLTDILPTFTPDLSERDAAGRLAERVVALGAEPLVILVGGEDRLRHRHPLPTTGPLARRAMAVLCARRHGMIANLTRWVAFAEPPAAIQDDERRILAVEADVLDATRPGSRLDDVFGVLTRSYPAHGFDPLEWTRHHQGGPTGYVGRDPRATSSTTEPIVAGQAFAWNPSAPGVKVEDTVLVGDEGVDVLTVDPRWPSIKHDGRARPATLRLQTAAEPPAAVRAAEEGRPCSRGPRGEAGRRRPRPAARPR